jgi:hypothetical protein
MAEAVEYGELYSHHSHAFFCSMVTSCTAAGNGDGRYPATSNKQFISLAGTHPDSDVLVAHVVDVHDRWLPNLMWSMISYER